MCTISRSETERSTRYNIVMSSHDHYGTIRSSNLLSQPSATSTVLHCSSAAYEPRHTTPHHTTPHHTTPRHTTPYHTTPHQATPHHTIPYHTIPHHATPRHATPRRAAPRHAAPRRATPRHTTPRPLYTSDAADEERGVHTGGRRLTNKTTTPHHTIS